jgi:hypothetical protein
MENKRALNDELRWLHLLAPVSQAALLLKVAQEARLLHLSLADPRSASPVARDLEHALEDAMDAMPGEAADDAAGHLVDVLRAMQTQGLQISAELTDVEVDGALGLGRLPLLSAVLGGQQIAQAA